MEIAKIPAFIVENLSNFTFAMDFHRLLLIFASNDFVCLILFFMSYQQSFSYVGTGLPWLNQY